MLRAENAEYYHARQACYTCLNPHDGVDTEVVIEGEGVLFLCRNCVATMAQTLGFSLDDRGPEIAELKSQVDEMTLRLAESEAQLLRLDEAAEHIRQRRESLAKAREVKAEKAAVSS